MLRSASGVVAHVLMHECVHTCRGVGVLEECALGSCMVATAGEGPAGADPPPLLPLAAHLRAPPRLSSFPPGSLPQGTTPNTTGVVMSAGIDRTERSGATSHNIPWAHTTMSATVCPSKTYVRDCCFMSTQLVICCLVRHLQMHTVALSSSQFTLCLEQLTSSAQAAQSGLCCANATQVA